MVSTFEKKPWINTLKQPLQHTNSYDTNSYHIPTRTITTHQIYHFVSTFEKKNDDLTLWKHHNNIPLGFNVWKKNPDLALWKNHYNIPTCSNIPTRTLTTYQHTNSYHNNLQHGITESQLVYLSIPTTNISCYDKGRSQLYRENE